MNKTILIGGGSGLIGSRLTELLLQKGYQVRHLGRKAKEGTVRGFAWDVDRGTIDERAFEGVDAVINLAGANISGARWSEEYKKELLTSRIRSTKLVVDFLDRGNHSVQHFIQGSAIGYYGFGDASVMFGEEDRPGNDFLAQLVVAWEQAAQLQASQTLQSVVRTGIALSTRGGALVELAKPIRWWAGAALGSGHQLVSWIHVDDLCEIFVYLLEHKLGGVFNAVAPLPASNKQMTQVVARTLHKPLLLPNVPAFVLKVILGEMSSSVLNGSYVSAEKIQRSGFKFKFETLEPAIIDLYGPR